MLGRVACLATNERLAVPAAAASLEAQSAEASATVAQLTSQLEKAGAETMNMRQAMAVMKQQARCFSSPHGAHWST